MFNQKPDPKAVAEAARKLKKFADTADTVMDYANGVLDVVDDFITNVRANADKLEQQVNEQPTHRKQSDEVPKPSRNDKIRFVQNKMLDLGLRDTKWFGDTSLLSDTMVNNAYYAWGGK